MGRKFHFYAAVCDLEAHKQMLFLRLTHPFIADQRYPARSSRLTKLSAPIQPNLLNTELYTLSSSGQSRTYTGFGIQ